MLNLNKFLADVGSQTTGGTPGGSGGPISIPNPLQVNSFSDLIDRITGYLMVIGAPIVTLMVLWGAFQILTAGANPDNVTKGRKTITYAVIGYAVILISKGLTLIIKDILGSK